MEMDAGWRWRRSRDLEAAGTAVWLLRLMMTAEPSVKELTEMFPGYKRED